MNYYKMRMSLQTKFTLLLSSLVIGIIVVISVCSYMTYHKTIKDIEQLNSDEISRLMLTYFSHNAETMTQLLAQKLVNPLYYYDLVAVRKMLRDTLKQNDVVDVILLDNDCRILQDGSEEVLRFGQAYSFNTHCNNSPSAQASTTVEKDILVTSAPIQFSDKILGSIIIELSLKNIPESLKGASKIFTEMKSEAFTHFSKNIFLTSIPLIIVVFISTLLYASRLIKPINRLKQHVTHIGQGNYAQPIIFSGRKDELGELETSFEQMRRDLQKSTVSIEKLTQEINDKIIAEKQRDAMAEQLQKAQRMETIGQLAAGVAHDLNNILSGIVSMPQLMLATLPKDSPLESSLNIISASGTQAALIVQDLLTLGRSGTLTLEPIDIADIIRNYFGSQEHRTLANKYPGITFSQSFNDDPMRIKGSPIHITRCLANLISNAADAIQDHGEITIRLSKTSLVAPLKGYSTITPGDYINLSIEDTGIGIEDSDIDRIFEPFYTKKTLGRSGTGLGMAIIWNTIKEHSGYITVHSDNNKGTLIKTFFPIADDLPSQSADLPPSGSLPRGNMEKILLVDDMQVQLDIGSSILEQLGYQVECVHSGESCLAVLDSYLPDLIILDMIMEPGLNGLQTCEKIFSIHPDARVLIASGYSENAKTTQALKLGVKQYISKPYSLKALGMAVHEILVDKKTAPTTN